LFVCLFPLYLLHRMTLDLRFLLCRGHDRNSQGTEMPGQGQKVSAIGVRRGAAKASGSVEVQHACVHGKA